MINLVILLAAQLASSAKIESSMNFLDFNDSVSENTGIADASTFSMDKANTEEDSDEGAFSATFEAPDSDDVDEAIAAAEQAWEDMMDEAEAAQEAAAEDWDEMAEAREDAEEEAADDADDQDDF